MMGQKVIDGSGKRISVMSQQPYLDIMIDHPSDVYLDTIQSTDTIETVVSHLYPMQAVDAI